MAGGSKGGGNKFQTGQVNARATPSTGGTATPDPNARATPSTGFNPIEIQNDVNQYGMNTQANVSAANRVVNDLNMAQIQQLFQLLNTGADGKLNTNTGADGKLNTRTRYDK